MRKPILISILLAALVAAGARSASGETTGFLDRASGHYGFSGTAAGSTFDVYPFTFTARVYSDGSASGRYRYTQVRDGVELSIAGSLTCGVIRGNQTWVGGIIEESSRANLLGLDMWFQVQDLNRRPPHSQDMSSTVGAGGPGTAQAYCDEAPPVRFPFFLDRGDLQVHG